MSDELIAALQGQLANLREAHILQKQIDDRKLASAEAALKQKDELFGHIAAEANENCGYCIEIKRMAGKGRAIQPDSPS